MSMMNSTVKFVVGNLGLNMQGAEVLTVRGRKSGEPRSVVVNPLELNGATYLMSPRGQTQWVKNLREDTTLTLHRGSHSNGYLAEEVADAAVKVDVLRNYLDRWSWQVKNLMGADKNSSDDELRAIIDTHPVFVLRRS